MAVGWHITSLLLLERRVISMCNAAVMDDFRHFIRFNVVPQPVLFAKLQTV